MTKTIAVSAKKMTFLQQNRLLLSATVFAVVAVVVLLAAGCGGDTTESTPANDAPPADVQTKSSNPIPDSLDPKLVEQSIASSKETLEKLKAAIDRQDFSAAEQWMTKEGAADLALSVVIFAIEINDSIYGQDYPAEFDALRESTGKVLKKYDLLIDIDSLGPGHEAITTLVEKIGEGQRRTDLVSELWAIEKNAPTEVIPFRGEIQRSGYQDETVFLQIGLSAPGEEKPFDVDAPPAVFMFVRDGEQWKFGGLDADKTESAQIYHEQRLAMMPQTMEDPSFSGLSETGEEISTEQYKGKLVLVDFWGTWCGPCLQKLPTLEAIHREFNDKGLEIIGVARNEAEDLEAFFKTNPLPWKNIADDGSLSQTFGIRAYPTLILIDQEGNHIASNLEDDQLIERIGVELELTPEVIRTARTNITDVK